MSKPFKNLAVLSLLAAAVAGWLFLAPRPLGGPVSYVVTDGISMQPKFHSGDLVILREQDSYEVGDVAGYNSESLGRIVMHRIVGVSDGHYLFRGDNNDFVDQDRPTADQLLGAKWLVVPGGGKALTWVGEPRNAALFAGVIVLLLMSGLWSPARRRRRRARHNAPRESRPPLRPRRPARPVLAFALVVGLTSAVLGGIAWTRPLQDHPNQAVRYETRGEFSYSGDVDKTPAYQDGHVSSGDPIFLKLVDQVRFRFDYDVSAPGLTEVTGDGDLLVTMSDVTGWRYEQAVDATYTPSDTGGSIEGTVDVAQIRRVLARFSTLTEIQQAAYTLSIQPRVHVEANVQGQPASQDLEPKLNFALDPLRARLQIPTGQDETAPVGDPLHPVTSGVVDIPQTVPATMTVGPVSLLVERVRTVSLVGLGLALLLLLIGLRGRSVTNEIDAISETYRSIMVDASSATAPVERRSVGVLTIAELARVAQRYDRFILHEEDNGIHTYSVEDDGVVFWYQALERGVGEVEAIRERPIGRPRVVAAPDAVRAENA